MEKHGVGDVAKLLGVSMTTVYKKTRKLKAKLEGMTTREKGSIYFTPEAVEAIRQEITTAPKETVLSLTPVPMIDMTPITVRLEEMGKVMLAMAEKMNGLVESNKIILEENHSLRQEISTLQKAIEYKKPEPIQADIKKETLIPSEFQGRRADPAEVVLSQRKVSAWESIQLAFDDCLGFFFGRG